jgi:hypothetical protein
LEFQRSRISKFEYFRFVRIPQIHESLSPTCGEFLRQLFSFSTTQVKCQETRQQGLNRFIARKLLLDKIESDRRERAAAERARVEKLRRQKRKLSRSAKERMLADKARHSQKKARRRATGYD